jgi:four helix bundle protein
MTPQQLKARTKRFALDIVRFCPTLPRTYEGRRIAGQLFSAGTAVGAAYRAVCRCKSDPDFIAKLGTCIEEADESGYWLEIAIEGGFIAPAAAAPLLGESDELTRIFVASRETVRERSGAEAHRESKIKNQESIKNLESRIKNSAFTPTQARVVWWAVASPPDQACRFPQAC